jgi:hypothetical protein
MKIPKITVCGGGNGAQTLVPIATRNLDCPVDIYAPWGDEAERLHGPIEITGGVRAAARPRRVSVDAREVVPGSSVVVLVLPAFAHESTLKQIVPFLDRDAWVGAIPARGGFYYPAARVLAECGRDDVTLFGLQTLPWSCRIERYGKLVRVLGVKKAVDAASRPAGRIGEMAPILAAILGLPIGTAANGLALTLANAGQLIHPGIMYSLFADWDGEPLTSAPLFYHGLSQAGADLLAGLSDEIQHVRARLEPLLDLSAVRPLYSWLLRSYGDAIDDPSTLRSAFRTNRAYGGLTAPMREVEPGKFAPDLAARYLAEDVPYGLAVSRAIARIAGVETPLMERVIAWAGESLGKDFLDRDVGETRIPQNYGLESLDELIAFEREGY